MLSAPQVLAGGGIGRDQEQQGIGDMAAKAAARGLGRLCRARGPARSALCPGGRGDGIALWKAESVVGIEEGFYEPNSHMS
jgi:hypothetical protein